MDGRSDSFERYLRLLDVPRRPPTLDALRELVHAHVCRVPFENVSKILNHRTLGLTGLPGLARFLDGIERFRFGGTCYTNNFYLNRLLAALGYDVMLCGADMTNPDAHLVNIVEQDGRPYLVDGGYGAPFLTPLPLDLDHDQVIQNGDERFVLKPRNEEGRSRMEQYRGDSQTHQYEVKPVPRQIAEFETIIADSYRPDAMFMNMLRLVRVFPEGSVSVRDRIVVETRGTDTTVRTVADRDELVSFVENRFGIPASITIDIVAGVVA